MKKAAIILLVCLLCGCGKINTNRGTLPQQTQSVTANDKIINMYAIRENDLNPLLTTSESGRVILSLVFRPLVSIGQNFDYNCCLAENISSDDSTTYSITLKNNITWDDGSALTSADVDYTVQKIIEYGDKSPYFENLSHIISYSKNGGNGYTFTLDAPDSGFPCLLNFPIVKNGSLSENFTTVGTGEYKITEYKKFTSFVLSAKTPRGEGFADKIKVSLLPDNQSSFSSYKLGKIDVLKLSADDASTYSVDATGGYISSNTNRYTFLAVNHGNTLLSDPVLRRIITEITSSENVITDLMPEFAIQTDSFVNPSAYFATKNETTFGELKDALETAGYKPDENGIRTKDISGEKRKLSFDILVNGDNPGKVIAAEYIANLLGSYGINITVTTPSYNDYVNLLSSGNFDLALCEIMISLNNNYTFLMGTDGSANFGGYCSEKADQLLASITSTVDKTEKTELLRQLQHLFYTDMPHIPLWFQTTKIVYSNNIGKAVPGNLADDFSAISSWTVN